MSLSSSVGRGAWGDHEEQVCKAIRNKNLVDRKTKLEKLIADCKNPNAWRFWRDAQYSLLFYSSMEDCHLSLRLLLEKGADPTWRTARGTTVLHLMAKRNQVEMAERSLAKVTNIKRLTFLNAATPKGWTPLMSACENNNLAFVKWLVAKGATINGAMDTGWTSLHAAAKNGNVDIAAFLLEKGADKNMKAAHRDYGRNLLVEDVTTDEAVLQLLSRY